MKYLFGFLLFILVVSQLQAAQLSLNSQSFVQGQTIQAQIEVTRPVSKNTCVFRGKSYPVFQVDPHRWQVLIGSDVNTPTGSYVLAFTSYAFDESLMRLQTTINISQGHFRRSLIAVPDSKKSIATPQKMENEANIMGPFFAKKSSVKLWQKYFGWPVHGAITTPYGASRVYDNGVMVSWHRGVDIYAPKGTPVLAPEAGRVILSHIFATHGQTIMIDHGHSVVSIYNHLSKRIVKKGDLVKKGSKIGLVGDTGLATGPHLHWGISVGNVRVDPLFWLSNKIK